MKNLKNMPLNLLIIGPKPFSNLEKNPIEVFQKFQKVEISVWNFVNILICVFLIQGFTQVNYKMGSFCACQSAHKVLYKVDRGSWNCRVLKDQQSGFLFLPRSPKEPHLILISLKYGTYNKSFRVVKLDNC